MLFLSTKLQNMPLMSVRTGGRIGTITAPIINPHNLHIDGFYCQSVHSKNNQVLLDVDIRDISARGVIINDHFSLSDPEELVRLQPIIELEFTLEGKTVLASKKKLGKVAEYSFDVKSFFIQKLYVQPPPWKGISINRLTFDRNSVIEVTDTQIIVSGPEETVTKKNAVRSANSELAGYSASTSLISENE